MIPYLETARHALTLSKKGKTNVEISDALGLRYAKDAANAVTIGEREQLIESSRLTQQEITVILMLAKNERDRNSRGDTSAFNGKHLGGFGWRVGQALRVIRKRLGYTRKGEQLHSAFDLHYATTGLGLIDHWHGGGVRLTRAGWALVHVLEAGEGGQ